MRTRAAQFLLLAALLLGCAARAADLPRVLILGDEFYSDATSELAKTLKGQAVVTRVRIPDDVPPTTESFVAAFDRIVGTQTWDVIHFNLGLGDLTHRAPGMKSFRVLPQRAGGIPAARSSDYEKNHEALIQKLARTGARLVWASTTPILGTATGGVLIPGSEIEYNRRAAAVMARHKIPVNDLHTYALAQLKTPGKRTPPTLALPSVVPLAPPMLEALRPLLPNP